MDPSTAITLVYACSLGVVTQGRGLADGFGVGVIF